MPYPENVFVANTSQIKVLDFGIAKALGSAEHGTESARPTSCQRRQPMRVVATTI
jgi:serine/threonine protein kinase